MNSELVLALSIIELYKKYGHSIKNDRTEHNKILQFFQETRDCIVKNTPELKSEIMRKKQIKMVS